MPDYIRAETDGRMLVRTDGQSIQFINCFAPNEPQKVQQLSITVQNYVDVLSEMVRREQRPSNSSPGWAYPYNPYQFYKYWGMFFLVFDLYTAFPPTKQSFRAKLLN